MKTNIIILVVAAILQISCEVREDKNVKYIATEATSEFSLAYRNEAGELITVNVEANSATDRWEYSFIAEQGEIVYASGNYKDISSALKIMILIDGKVFKQASSRSDTVRYVTVSGVIPY